MSSSGLSSPDEFLDNSVSSSTRGVEFLNVMTLRAERNLALFNSFADEATTCEYYQFTCRDGSCIDDRLKCNGREDCPDGSDELGCGMFSAALFLTELAEPSPHTSEFYTGAQRGAGNHDPEIKTLMLWLTSIHTHTHVDRHIDSTLTSLYVT